MRRKRLIRPTVLTLPRPDKTRQRRIRQDRINSAYSPLPRHLSQKVAAGEFVTLDFGALYQGYCSDMTRTLLVNGEGVRFGAHL